MTSTGFTHGYCASCGTHQYVRPLHGERGGPRYCLVCIGKWDAEHTPKRRARRLVIMAFKAYEAAGCSLYSEEFDKLKLASGNFGRDVADDFKDLTTELLTAALALTHPDRHPPERRAEAQRVTQELTALKPFVFPAPKPEPEPKPKPEKERGDDARDALKSLSKLFDYPCEDCRDTVPVFYCDACRAEYDKREQADFERRTTKQRADYARRRKRALARRRPTTCSICLKEFTRKRGDARFCSDRCRQQAHRKAPVTNKSTHQNGTASNRDRWRRAILALLDRHAAIYLNDLLPANRTRAQYQQLCRIVADLEDHGEIDTYSYMVEWDHPGHKALAKRGHKIKDRNVALLKDDERLSTPPGEERIKHQQAASCRNDEMRP